MVVLCTKGIGQENIIDSGPDIQRGLLQIWSHDFRGKARHQNDTSRRDLTSTQRQESGDTLREEAPRLGADSSASSGTSLLCETMRVPQRPKSKRQRMRRTAGLRCQIDTGATQETTSRRIQNFPRGAQGLPLEKDNSRFQGLHKTLRISLPHCFTP